MLSELWVKEKTVIAGVTAGRGAGEHRGGECQDMGDTE